MKKIALLIFSFSSTLLLQAQDTASFKFTFNHFALSVKDVESAAEFYKTVLGLKEITNRTKMEGIRWLSLGEDKELHLISVIKDGFVNNKAIHLGITTPNFDAFIKRLDLLKINYSDWPGKPFTVTQRADGVKQIYFQDPDSHWIEVNNVGQK